MLPGRPDSQQSSEITLLDARALNIAAARWRTAAKLEHASIGWFASISLEMMMHSAPLEMLRRIHRAALQEADHAQICLQIAQAIDGELVELGAQRAPRPCSLSRQDLANALVREAVVPFALGASEAWLAAKKASIAGVRTALKSMVREESSHARLALDLAKHCSPGLVLIDNPVVSEEVERLKADALASGDIAHHSLGLLSAEERHGVYVEAAKRLLAPTSSPDLM